MQLLAAQTVLCWCFLRSSMKKRFVVSLLANLVPFLAFHYFCVADCCCRHNFNISNCCCQWIKRSQVAGVWCAQRGVHDQENNQICLWSTYSLIGCIASAFMFGRWFHWRDCVDSSSVRTTIYYQGLTKHQQIDYHLEFAFCVSFDDFLNRNTIILVTTFCSVEILVAKWWFIIRKPVLWSRLFSCCYFNNLRI
jgi:hypothetical protein